MVQVKVKVMVSYFLEDHLFQPSNGFETESGTHSVASKGVARNFHFFWGDDYSSGSLEVWRTAVPQRGSEFGDEVP